MNEERGPVVGPDRELPLSPELVLVAPELGEHALAKERNGRILPAAAQAPVLPAGAPPAPPPDEAQPAEAPPAEALSAAGPPAGAPPAEAAPAPPTWGDVEPAPPGPPAGRRLTVGGAVMILLGTLVVLGGGFLVARSVFSGSSTPSVEPATRDVPPAETAPAATQPSRAPRAPAVPAPTPRQRAQPKAKPKPKPHSTPTPTPKPASSPTRARAPRPAPATVRPTSGGYVLPGGRFQVSSNGRAIVGLTLQTTCAGQLTLPSIRIAPTGAFAFDGDPTGSSAATVRVRGTFSSPTEARGTTQVSGGTCRAQATSFVARLS